jgi:hypothetical protein
MSKEDGQVLATIFYLLACLEYPNYFGLVRIDETIAL